MSAVVYFSEPDCDWGGCACGAWSDWFEACVIADPHCDDEGAERDPAPTTYAFDPKECARPEVCKLFKISQEQSK